MPIAEAKKLGAMALFGEKYGDVVRVVNMGGYSVELCGGCHLSNTSQAGLFKILSEGGVAAGVRRIEAVTGDGVLKYIEEKNSVIEKTAAALKTTEGELVRRAEAAVNEAKELKNKLDAVATQIANAKAGSIMESAEKIGEVSAFISAMNGSSVDDMRKMGDAIKDKNDSCVCVFAAVTDGKISFVAMADKSAVEKGVHAGKIIKEITAVCGGSGGGKPDSAQGGGKEADKVEAALLKAKEIIGSQLN